MHLQPVLLVSLVLLSAASCVPVRGVNYTGVRAPQAVQADGVAVKPYALTNEAILGEVQAACEVGEVQLEQGVALSDLLCSEELLTSEALHRTAEVGGTALVQSKCQNQSGRLSCAGIVVRRQGSVAQPAAVGLQGARTSAFDIAVQTAGTQHRLEPAQAQRHLGLEVVPRVPLSDAVLAEVWAHCEGECAVESVREAVVSTAGALGADHVVHPHCSQAADGWLCRGLASAAQIRVAPDAPVAKKGQR